jgi:tocopherol cyclase
MEGYFWRVSDPASGRVIDALLGVCRDQAGRRWAFVAIASEPGGILVERIIEDVRVGTGVLELEAGTVLRVSPDRLWIDLDPMTRLTLEIEDPVLWPRRPLGALGLAHLIPGLGQYWLPHLLGGRARVRGNLGDVVLDSDDAFIYAEKNWGGGFPQSWWWGQAQAFDGHPDLMVAFAGGRLSPVFKPTALVLRRGSRIQAFGPPGCWVTAQLGDGTWEIRARGPRTKVILRGSGSPDGSTTLPVPLPDEHRTVAFADQHFRGEVELEIRRDRRLIMRARSSLAGLETGSVKQ